MSEELPGNLKTDDFLFSRNIGAYSIASSTQFNGFPPARIIHVNN
jgi:ornithine decarboxylase